METYIFNQKLVCRWEKKDKEEMPGKFWDPDIPLSCSISNSFIKFDLKYKLSLFGKMITYINQKFLEGHGQRGEAWEILTILDHLESVYILLSCSQTTRHCSKSRNMIAINESWPTLRKKVEKSPCWGSCARLDLC